MGAEGNQYIRVPIASGESVNIRWGTLDAPLNAQTTTGVNVSEYKFTQNAAGTGGSWTNKNKKFLTIDRCLPSGTIIPSGKWVGCSKVSKKIWCVVVVECVT